MRSTTTHRPAPPIDDVPDSPVFVHDFVPLPLDPITAAGRFRDVLTPEIVILLVAEAWNAEASTAGAAGLSARACHPDRLRAEIGQPRRRPGAIVLPLTWWSAEGTWVAPLDADIELAAFGPNRAHLHLLGRSTLAPGIDARTEAASLYHRLAVAVVRHVLNRLAELLTAAGPMPTIGGCRLDIRP
ncbi:MAG: hypothetical protein AAF547_09000 [Actinomycetota bacterium]